jgi:hypothetical protein
MAGSLRDGYETSILQHIFQNANIANIGDATGLRGSSTPGTFAIALYTVAPTDSTAGTEATYTGYARVTVARSAAGFAVSGNNVSNNAAVTFPACTGGFNPIVAFAICLADVEDVDDQVVWGDITDPGGGLAVSDGITPEFAANVLDVNID